MIIPFVRQAAKLQAEQVAQAAKASAARAALPAAEAATAATPQNSSALGIREALAAAREHKAKEQDEEWGKPVEPVSPWIGLQALGAATALVFGTAGLGAWGAAKYLGVESMEEFTAKMRQGVETTYPDFVSSVRRVDPEADKSVSGPSVIDQHGELDEELLRDWVVSLGEGIDE
ncbi:hypothetical protein VHUM_04144 [Vanrija humicola]|uniref:Uncharacterized protein n=1 Tax=Vanrija humicola TaxID=5417 RepID=A0A7D8UXF0_VANHU|nr:hypothetical protein VHUM_04144 [Vanrija humicola]